MPCHPARARAWVRRGRAVRRFDRGLFYVRLVDRRHGATQDIAIGIDPGSKKEGLTVKSGAHTFLNIQADAVTWVKDAVETRRTMRRTRRYRKRRAGRIGRIAPVETRQGWETKALRDGLGLKKSGDKMAEVFAAHCVDSWVLANWWTGGHTKPDTTRLLYVTPLRVHRRQLHRLQPETGGIRKPYGGTRSLGLKRGETVKHPTHGVVYVGGTMGDRISLHSTVDRKRICQNAKPSECKRLAYTSWRTRLLPGLKTEVSAA